MFALLFRLISRVWSFVGSCCLSAIDFCFFTYANYCLILSSVCGVYYDRASKIFFFCNYFLKKLGFDCGVALITVYFWFGFLGLGKNWKLMISLWKILVLFSLYGVFFFLLQICFWLFNWLRFLCGNLILYLCLGLLHVPDEILAMVILFFDHDDRVWWLSIGVN